MNAARVGSGDLLLTSAGPGYFATVEALSKEARRDSATVIVLTSQPTATVQQQLGATLALQVPATCLPAAATASGSTAAAATRAPASPLLMGSSYELALQLFFDLVCVLLQHRLGLTAADMTARHTNLE